MEQSRQFQSAPRALARGDASSRRTRARQDRFQSAPRALARGDKFFPHLLPVYRSFNPRPAHSRGATAVLPTSSTAKL